MSQALVSCLQHDICLQCKGYKPLVGIVMSWLQYIAVTVSHLHLHGGSRRMRTFWSCDQLMWRPRPLDLVRGAHGKRRDPWGEVPEVSLDTQRVRGTGIIQQPNLDPIALRSPLAAGKEQEVEIPPAETQETQDQHNEPTPERINMDQHESTMTNVALRLRSSSMPWLWGFNTVLLRSEHLWEPDPQHQRICCELSGCRLPPGLWCKATLQWRTQICPILTARPFPASQVPQLQATARKAALLKSRYWSYRISNRYGAKSVWYTSIDWWLFSWSSLQAMPWPSW